MKTAAFLSLTMLPLWGSDVAPAAAPLDQALPVLQSGYVDFSQLQIRPGDRLETLVAQSHGELTLEQPAAATVPAPPILAALLPEQVVYCRAASFRPAGSWPALAAEVGKWIGQGAGGVILDLRSNEAPADFEGAARLAGLFTAPGTALFSLRDARQQLSPCASIAPGSGAALPPIAGPLVILIDDRTAGAAEALAAALRLHGALVMGHATPGRAGVFAGTTLVSGATLRYLAAEVVLPDGTTLWGHPVQPDIGVASDARKEQAALALIGQQHIADVIGEAAQRHRMSEASLVRGEDPEIDSSIVTPGAKTGVLLSGLATQDLVLVDALDSLKAIRLSQRAEAAPAGGITAPSASSAAR